MTKTMKVEDIRILANNTLKNKELSQEYKKGICGLIESILMNSKNYHGFQYIYWAEIGYKLWIAAGEPGFPEKQKYIGNEYDRQYY